MTCARQGSTCAMPGAGGTAKLVGMPPHAIARPAPRARAWVWGAARALGLALALGAPAVGHAAQLHAFAPAGDDWSLEHEASDPALVGQRFSKLRRAPFDRAQWRA